MHVFVYVYTVTQSLVNPLPYNQMTHVDTLCFFINSSKMASFEEEV